MLISAVVVKIQAYYISGAIFRSTRERTKKLLTLDRVWPIRMKCGDILLCQKVCWPLLRQSIDSLLILRRGESCRNTHEENGRPNYKHTQNTRLFKKSLQLCINENISAALTTNELNRVLTEVAM